MSTNLTLQPWGVRGAGVSLVLADAAGNAVQAGVAGAALVVRNAGGAPITLTLAGVGTCNYGRPHSLIEAIPNDSIPHLIPLHWDVVRFGLLASVTYTSVTGVTVAAVVLSQLLGLGTDAETPVALGPNPGIVPVYSTVEEVLYEVAANDGMILQQASNTGLVPLLQIKNEGPAPRTIYFNAAKKCSFGFYDDEVITIGAGVEEPHPKLLTLGRFGSNVAITYDSPAGLRFAAVQMESY